MIYNRDIEPVLALNSRDCDAQTVRFAFVNQRRGYIKEMISIIYNHKHQKDFIDSFIKSDALLKLLVVLTDTYYKLLNSEPDTKVHKHLSTKKDPSLGCDLWFRRARDIYAPHGFIFTRLEDSFLSSDKFWNVTDCERANLFYN